MEGEDSEKDTGKEVLPLGADADADVAEEEVGLEIGDTVLVVGGQLNGTVGKLYGFSTDRINILPRGATDRVIKIPMINGAPDPDLELQSISILKKAARPGFVSLIDLRAGQNVETFGDESAPTGVFKVISVNEEADSAVFEDETGGQEELEFNFTGINPELPYRVIRTREAPAEGQGAEGQEGQTAEGQQAVSKGADVGPVSLVAVEDNDLLEGQAPSAKEDAEDAEAAATEPSIEFALGEEIELEMENEMKERGSAEIIYDDVFQRSEMLSQQIRLLPLTQRRDAVKLQEVRRFVEQMILMRNEVVKYNKTGDPAGIKATSLNTLAELISRPDVTMSRKIVEMTKIIYNKHSENQDTDPAPGILEDGLYMTYDKDIIERAENLQTAAEAGTGENQVEFGMPKFFIDMEKYRSQIQTPYIFEGTAAQPVEKDEEVFRNEIPDFEEPQVNALDQPLNLPPPPSTAQIPFSIVRTLTGRKARFSKGDPIRLVEPPEIPSYTNVLVFPLSAQRDLGIIRSGVLAQDMSLGAMESRSMEDILKDLGDISDFPTAESILNLGVKGNIMGNVTIKDWLNSLDINVSGLHDTWLALRGYGARGIEWNKEQATVIQEKIERRLAGLRLFMAKQREENNVMMANLKFQPNNLLSAEDSARLLTRVESEPLLQTIYAKFKEYMGDLASIDINWFSFIFIEYPDLLLAVLGQKPDLVVRERIRHVSKLYIQAINLGYRLKKNIQESGEPPEVNLCKHVGELADIRKAAQRNSDEPRDVTKIKGLMQLLNKFRGRTEDDHVWCRVCKKHLLCGHELILIQEYLRPAEKDALHKEMLIKFSGGQFSGKYVCRVCGQAMSDLEFDNGLEFDDEGRPMMGRSVMVDEAAIAQSEIDDLFTGPADVVDEANFGNDVLNEMYRTMKKIASGLGIDPEKEDYKSMVNLLSSYVATLPTREAYAAATKGKRAQDFDIYYSIRYATAAAAVVLLNIQTRMPDYVVYYTSADCKDGFLGYPLEGPETMTGITCVASIVAGINEKVFPWSMTTLQKEDNLVKRRDTIVPFIKGQIDAFLKNPEQQLLLQRKREYRTRLFGKVGGLKADQIAKSFRPVPFVMSEEDVAKDAVMGESATPEKKATAWIRMAHTVARGSAALNPDAPISETTCCLHPVTSATTFWSDKGLPTLEPRSIRRTAGGKLTTTFYTEMPKVLEGKVDEKEYYKLFVNLCWQGDNKGLHHKLGLTLTCSECGLNFKENPNLPYSTDANPKVQKEEEAKTAADIQAHIVSQGIIINEETAQDLLTIARLKMKVLKDDKVYIPLISETFSRLADTVPEPIENWRSTLNSIQVTLAELGSGATKIQIATAAERLVQIVSEKEEFIRARLGADVFRYIETFTRKTPRECGEAVSAFLLVPFNRWLNKVDVTGFKILNTYNLSYFTKEDIMKKGLGNYLRIIGEEAELKGLLLRKVRTFVKELSDLCRNIFAVLRPILIPGGSMMLSYLMRAYVMGIIQKFIDPHNIPDGDDDLVEGVVDMKLLYRALAQCLTKYAVGAKIPSEEEIRNALEKRAEKEKQQFIGELDRMTKDRRQVELTEKALGMGKWAAGGSKAIRKYDEDRYEVERAERAAAGIVDYAGAGEEGGATDLFGFNMGGEDGGEGGTRMDGDYTDGAMREDEY